MLALDGHGGKESGTRAKVGYLPITGGTLRLRAAGLFPVSYPSAEAFLPDTERPYFDCLLLDVRLGGMSGIELRQRLNEMGSHIPVIFNTAHADPVDQERAAQVGCPAYLRKTESGELVLNAIRRVIQPNNYNN